MHSLFSFKYPCFVTLTSSGMLCLVEMKKKKEEGGVCQPLKGREPWNLRPPEEICGASKQHLRLRRTNWPFFLLFFLESETNLMQRMQRKVSKSGGLAWNLTAMLLPGARGGGGSGGACRGVSRGIRLPAYLPAYLPACLLCLPCSELWWRGKGMRRGRGGEGRGGGMWFEPILETAYLTGFFLFWGGRGRRWAIAL